MTEKEREVKLLLSMFQLINTFFFLIFTFISLVWWIPVVLLLFSPFLLIRKIKSKIERIASRIENVSEQKLEEFKTFKKLIQMGKRAETRSKRLYHSLTDKAYKKTVWWQRMEIIEAVPYGASVLDIGCGNGYLAQALTKNKKAKVTCLDVADFNRTEIPTILFDGISLPFADREFEVVILSFVLHHSEFQEKLLSEAARVCRGKIIIYEDETAIGAEKITAFAHSTIWNFLSDQEGKVIYHSPSQWRQIFSRNNLEILEEKSEWGIGSFVIPLKKAIFVLKNKN